MNNIEREIWDSEEQGRFRPGAVKAAIDLDSQQPYSVLVEHLDGCIMPPYIENGNENGLNYAWLRDEDSSPTDAMVLFNPLANGLTDGMLIRGEFMRRAAEHDGITDVKGKPLSVFVISAPTYDSVPRLSADDKELVRAGDLGPMAQEMLKVVTHNNIGRVALNGFSLGADMALAGARRSHSDLDVTGLSIGDPVQVTDRSVLKLGVVDFASKNRMKDVKRATEDSRIIAAQRSVGVGDGFFKSIFNKVNSDLVAKSLGKSRFSEHVSELANIHDRNIEFPFTVAYGGRSSITPEDDLETHLDALESDFGELPFDVIKVEGAKHAWGDNLQLLYKLYYRSLTGYNS